MLSYIYERYRAQSINKADALFLLTVVGLPELKVQLMFSNLFLSGIYLSDLQKHYADFNETWSKAFLGEGNTSLFKKVPQLIFKGDNKEYLNIRIQSA